MEPNPAHALTLSIHDLRAVLIAPHAVPVLYVQTEPELKLGVWDRSYVWRYAIVITRDQLVHALGGELADHTDAALTALLPKLQEYVNESIRRLTEYDR